MKRYDFNPSEDCYYRCGMVESPDGEYVDYDDAVALAEYWWRRAGSPKPQDCDDPNWRPWNDVDVAEATRGDVVEVECEYRSCPWREPEWCSHEEHPTNNQDDLDAINCPLLQRGPTRVVRKP